MMDLMPRVKAVSLSTLPEATATEVIIGEHNVALCRVGDTVHAIDGICPHRGGPLGQGALHGTMLVCPWHAWEFDCTTGANDFDPDIRQAKFAVTIDGDDVLVDLPDA